VVLENHYSDLSNLGVYPVDLKLLKRRAEMLDAVSTGLHPAAVVGQLAEKYGVSERALWSDWERRAKWVPVLLGLEKYAGFVEVVEQKLNAVQKAAWSIYLKASNDNARVGALRTVLDSLEIHGNIVQAKEVLERLDRLEEVAEKQQKRRWGGGSLH
jgi:hypothetical protein